MLGELVTTKASRRPDLLAPVVLEALTDLGLLDVVEVAEIDPAVADTATFCVRYGVAEGASANCVIVQSRRGEESHLCACVVLATARVDVNGLVRRRLGAKKVSFAPMELAIDKSAMSYGGITPIGLPPEWPVLIDAAVVDAGVIVIGSGTRQAKLVLEASLLARLPRAEVTEGLGVLRV